MQNLRRLLPAPGALYAFEAAGRLGSFTLAAEELGISQAAVSYAIKQLEARLGVTLFQRAHRQVRLTEIGERFHSDVATGLTHIRRSAESVVRARSDQHVTLSASTAFAAHWMLPRLTRFHGELPDVDLRLQTTDKDVDLGLEGISLGVRRGRESDWPEYDRAFLAGERIFAVASPSYLERIGGPLPAHDLNAAMLIHLDEPFRPRPRWSDWFRAASISHRDRGDGLRLNDYGLVIQAALEGEGIALGWAHIVDRLLARGLLVAASPFVFTSDFGFYLVWRKSHPLSRHAAATRDWIVAETEAARGG